MDVWILLLYAAASVLALRSLIGLMAAYKRQCLRELAAEYAREQRAPKRPKRDENSAETEESEQETTAA